MEDLYDDLTNYEDVNAVEELRTENKELKEMLANHSVSMEKLQKEILQEYNTIEAEFKKLELNYSSLLMTARSEIKRKTERINQLNTEKDLMVLEALKSGLRIRRNYSTGQTNYESAPGIGNYSNKEDNFKQKNVDIIKKERREAPVMPPKIAVPEPVTSDRNKSDNAVVKAEIPSTSKSSVNENIAKRKTDLNEPPKISARSIKDRRKSMPAVSLPVNIFSSDDELDRSSQAKDTRSDHIQSDNERRNTKKMSIYRNTNKSSETSSVDDRVHNYHDSTSRDYYKGKSSRYPDSNSNRSWDKNEVSLKYRKLYSPERAQKRQHRERHDDYHRYERERYKGRHPESPPHEFYNRHQLRKSDHRSEYDRYSHDHEKIKYYQDDKYSSSKYRSKDYDEPHAKRLRTESYRNPEGYSKENKRRYHEREHVDGQAGPSYLPHEYDMVRSSCQSPDFVHTDASQVTHPIKEILATAATHLEDPRKTSKRYVIWKKNGKETLSSAVGMNIDIRPVNKAVWNIQPMDIPVALVRRPSQCSDQLVKDIYMDIGNPETNLDFSIELGEVRENDEEIHEYRSKPKEIKNNPQDFKPNKQVTKDISKPAPDVLKIPLTTNIAKFRIPKLGQVKIDTHSKMDVPIIDLDENVPHHNNVYRKTVEDSSPKELLNHKQQYNEERANVEDSLPNNKKYGQIEHIIRTRSKEAENSLRKELPTHTQQYHEREESVNLKDSLPNSKTDSNRKSRSRERLDSFRKELSTHTQQYNEREEHVNVRDSLPNNKKDSKIEDYRKSRSRERLDSFRKELSTHTQQYNEREEHVNVRDSLPNNKKDSKIEDYRKSKSRERENSYRKVSSTNKQQFTEREERVKGKDSLPDNKKYSKIQGRKKSSSRERANSYRKKISTQKQQNEQEEHANIEDSLPTNKHISKTEVSKISRSRERIENQHQATLTKIAIVADDLELSDDNSDHMDTNKRIGPAKTQKNYEPTNEAETDDLGNNADDKTLTSSHNTEIGRIVDNAEIKDCAEKEKIKESDSAKKQKGKKKKSKAKEISKDLVEITADDIHVTEKKSRFKKEKESTPHETKEKFSDLFGDSSSLMTPEDLGIPSYLPVSEDTQDAVDMKINQIIDATPLIDNYEVPKDIQTQNRVEVNKIQETNGHDDIPKAVLQKSNTDVDDKEVITKASKRNEENLVEPSQLPSPIVYENLNPGTDLNDANIDNIVKTVIISTGIQPEIAYENKVEVINPAAEVIKPAAAVEVYSIQDTKDINLFPATKEYKIDLLKALATSTPHKEFSAVNPLVPDAAKTDIICDPFVSKAVATITNAEQVFNQTATNTLETNDVPDVRIFVKRRRKVLKRPPMT